MAKTVKKLPKWAIKKAGGINKKAWALARRGRMGRGKSKPAKAPKRRRTPRSVGGGSSNPSKPSYGTWFKMGRTVDIFSGPAQGALHRHGLSPDAGIEALRRYSGGMSEGEWDSDTFKGTYGGIGTGLARNWLRSKLGVYRGMGQKKIISFIMGANPELLAYRDEQDPFNNPRTWNDLRSVYDRAYVPSNNSWSISRPKFQQSVGLDFVLWGVQKAAEHWLNPLLPTGYNL